MTRRLDEVRILILGPGIKPVRHVFTDITTGLPSHVPIIHKGVEYKANIGASSAMECAKKGAAIHLISRTAENLEIIKDWIKKAVPNSTVTYSAVDVNDRKALEGAINSIPEDRPLYWLNSLGLGAGTVKIKDDNPYLAIEALSQDLIDAEFSVIKNTVMLLQILLPRFRKQEETRIIIISSMSAIRSFIGGALHCSAKAAISRLVNTITLEYYHDRIFVSDIRPGGCDTGLYDSPSVIQSIQKARENFGLQSGQIYLAPPSAVGKIIAAAFESEAHVTEVNLVARGQPPHGGS